MNNMITLEVVSKNGKVLATSCARQAVNLVYEAEYDDGDTITLRSQKSGFFVIQFDAVLEPTFVYLKEKEFVYQIPFLEKRTSYNPYTFAGFLHVIKARFAMPSEIECYKNLAVNPHDFSANTVCFPHASANIETRGEAKFAARNAINANTVNTLHGNYPYESWGINKDPNAEFVLDFGREVEIDKIMLITRADFPHDNYWKSAEIRFSDGSNFIAHMERSKEPHIFEIPKKRITKLTLCNLIQDETDPSPFPALTQIEVFGKEAV